MSYYEDCKIDDNSITIMNHCITVNDAIEQEYYRITMDILNRPSLFYELYIDKDIENKCKFEYLKHQIYPNERNKLNQLKPIIPQNIDDNNSLKISWRLLSSDMFIAALKFKIKEERITRNLRKNLEFTNHKIKIVENKLSLLIAKYINNLKITNNYIKSIETNYATLQQQLEINNNYIKSIETNYATLQQQLKINNNYIKSIETNYATLQQQLEYQSNINETSYIISYQQFESKYIDIKNNLKINNLKLNYLYYIIGIKFIIIVSLLIF